MTQKEIDTFFEWIKDVDILDKKNVDRIFSDMVKALRTIKDFTDIKGNNYDSNIAYLGRADVQAQANKWIRTHSFVKARVMIKEMNWNNAAPSYYMEWETTTLTGEQWHLNFWPCSECACVACLPSGNADERKTR